MTAKRDESRDLMFSRKGLEMFFDAVKDNRDLPDILPWPTKASLSGDCRYVPHSQYATLEAENASLSQLVNLANTAIETKSENVLALVEFVERIAGDGYCDHGSRMMFDAKNLIAKVTR